MSLCANPPYRALIVAVIKQALVDHAVNLRRQGRPIGKGDAVYPPASRCEPARWLESDADHPFTFQWCCEVLGISAWKMRERMYRRSFFAEARTLMRERRGA